MDASNDWNSKFWINELAQLTQNTTLNSSAQQQEEKRGEMTSDTTQHKFGKLVDLDETTSSEENTVNSLEEKSAGSETDTSSFTFTFPVKPTVDVVKREDATTATKDIPKKLEEHSYETEHVRCTLNDLLLGMDSPVIRNVILGLRGEKKEEDKEPKNELSKPSIKEQPQQPQQQQQQQTGNKITYSPKAAEFVPLSKQILEKKYSPDAKEFVPTSARKYNQEYVPPVKYSPNAKEFVPVQPSAKYSVDAKEFVPFTIKSSAKKYNVTAKEFIPYA